MVGGVGWGGCGVTWFLFGRLVHRPDGLQIHPRADNKQPSEGSRDWACPAAVPSSFVIALRGGVARRPINGANGDPERHTRCNLPPPLAPPPTPQQQRRRQNGGRSHHAFLASVVLSVCYLLLLLLHHVLLLALMVGRFRHLPPPGRRRIDRGADVFLLYLYFFKIALKFVDYIKTNAQRRSQKRGIRRPLARWL